MGKKEGWVPKNNALPCPGCVLTHALVCTARSYRSHDSETHFLLPIGKKTPNLRAIQNCPNVGANLPTGWTTPAGSQHHPAGTKAACALMPNESNFSSKPEGGSPAPGQVTGGPPPWPKEYCAFAARKPRQLRLSHRLPII